MNSKTLDRLLQGPRSEGDVSRGEEATCSTLQSLTLVEVNQMLLELELYQTALELKLWKAGTRASRRRLTKPLIEIVRTITLLSCPKHKQLSTE